MAVLLMPRRCMSLPLMPFMPLLRMLVIPFMVHTGLTYKLHTHSGFLGCHGHDIPQLL
jgi:hypothetical protein